MAEIIIIDQESMGRKKKKLKILEKALKVKTQIY